MSKVGKPVGGVIHRFQPGSCSFGAHVMNMALAELTTIVNTESLTEDREKYYTGMIVECPALPRMVLWIPNHVLVIAVCSIKSHSWM